MAGNTRGKIKEHLEGLHRNLDWAIVHCERIIGLVGNTHPELTDTITVIMRSLKELDDVAAEIYSYI